MELPLGTTVQSVWLRLDKETRVLKGQKGKGLILASAQKAGNPYCCSRAQFTLLGCFLKAVVPSYIVVRLEMGDWLPVENTNGRTSTVFLMLKDVQDNFNNHGSVQCYKRHCHFLCDHTVAGLGPAWPERQSAISGQQM